MARPWISHPATKLAVLVLTATTAVATWPHDSGPTCRRFGAGLVVCAPTDPYGVPSAVEEDGSAVYPNGLGFDPTTGTYTRLYWNV